VASAKPPTTAPQPQQAAQPARPSPANPPSQPKAAPRLPPAKASTTSATLPQPQLEESQAAVRPTLSLTDLLSHATIATPPRQQQQPARHSTVRNPLPHPPRAQAQTSKSPCSTTPTLPPTGAKWSSSKPRTTPSASASELWSKLSALVDGTAAPARPTAALRMLLLRCGLRGRGKLRGLVLALRARILPLLLLRLVLRLGRRGTEA
jgi:hypothetical protein